MARFRGSITKRARNLGGPIDGYPKTENLRRAYPSGAHGQARKKLSEYAVQLREKQRIKWTYGLLERQFRKYYESVVRKKGVTGTLLLQTLESRFDNILYRSGLVQTRPQARQLIVHGHLLIDGKPVDIPSYRMKPGQVITVREKSQPLFKTFQEGNTPVIPGWIDSDVKNLTARYTAVPERDQMPAFEEHLVIEYYSR
ncbi:MAG: 30S ribosomal protein S4 [Candidatus Melainabacteria bacterium]